MLRPSTTRKTYTTSSFARTNLTARGVGRVNRLNNTNILSEKRFQNRFSVQSFSSKRDLDPLNPKDPKEFNEEKLTPEEIQRMRSITHRMVNSMAEVEGGEDILSAMEQLLLQHEYENENKGEDQNEQLPNYEQGKNEASKILDIDRADNQNNSKK
eukprot:gb/GECH01011992.1/.p1 GENE.gb/GECH01011992.1/~~gb/GECH01011992.1/.p1  ORF type:complete len:156 (+),score=36.78 gb/GECH01011992.1/:1-468(+)